MSLEDYQFVERVGGGSYGSVWRVLALIDGRTLAIKKLSTPTPPGSKGYQLAMREFEILQDLRHCNVVALQEAYQSTSGRLYLVFEYVESNLRGVIDTAQAQHGGGLPPKQVQSITYQLLRALCCIHSKKVIHRDLKPSNVLVHDSGHVKVCDFGCATYTQPDGVADFDGYACTRWYRAPEIIVGGSYGLPVDVWALGCVFAELCTGQPLFPGKNSNDQLRLILACVGRLTERHMALAKAAPHLRWRATSTSEQTSLESRLPGLPRDALQLLTACLHPDPTCRLTADELLHLPYFDGVEANLPYSMDAYNLDDEWGTEPSAAARAASGEDAAGQRRKAEAETQPAATAHKDAGGGSGTGTAVKSDGSAEAGAGKRRGQAPAPGSPTSVGGLSSVGTSRCVSANSNVIEVLLSGSR